MNILSKRYVLIKISSCLECPFHTIMHETPENDCEMRVPAFVYCTEIDGIVGTIEDILGADTCTDILCPLEYYMEDENEENTNCK